MINKRFIVLMLACFLAFWQMGCGGSGDSRPETSEIVEEVDADGVVISTVSTLTLLTSSPQLSSNGEDSVTLTALARDSSQNIVTGVVTAFSIQPGSLGTIEVVSATTDSSGVATALLKAKPFKQSRDIEVVASADGQTSNVVTLSVTGTVLTLSGSSSVVAPASVDLTVNLKDSSGNNISGETLAVTSLLDNSITSDTLVTDSNGQVVVTVTADSGNAGSDTITVTAYDGSTSKTHVLYISQDDKLSFSTPLVSQEILLSTQATTVTAVWTDGDGVGRDAKDLIFSASRGTLTDETPGDSIVTATTDVNGEASVTIAATTAGPSIINITGIDSSGNTISASPLHVEFVADTPATMTLQPSPASVNANIAGGTTEKSEVVALVRDSNANVVKNQTINFNLEDPTSGSIDPVTAITDSFGMATTIYTAGATSSKTDGVRITAVIEGSSDPIIQEEATMTVANRALFIVLGTTNLVVYEDDTKYSMPYTALVTDASGHPVSGVSLTVTILPQRYFKGDYVAWYDLDGDFERWVQDIDLLDDAATDSYDERSGCLDEDRNNNNGRLDTGEDYNNNGQLDPGITATLNPSSITTNSIGFADFSVIYPKNYGNWVEMKITAQALVDGTESRTSELAILSIPAEDLTNADVVPPGFVSPFGREAIADQGSSCSE